MLKKIIHRVFGKDKSGTAKATPSRQEYGVKVHGIDRQLIDERAIDVVETLQDAGHEAYIVGGAVRDLLLGLRPKDFDVATDATPEEVKALFRRAFIIGRRFRIVHVVYGRGREHEVIEVSTFRANVDHAEAPKLKGNAQSQKTALMGMKHAVDASGRVLRDNVWGDLSSDAARRDFTVNAMYYDPSSEVVVDYHGGIADAKKRILRMIGDPATRYREDPVRIIRAVRFAAKLSGLGFKLQAQTAEPIVKLKGLLADVPPSRLFDEMLKLLQTGHALASVRTLRALGLQQGIYPLLDVVVERADTPMVQGVLSDTDRRVAQGKPVAPSYLLACVLWSDVVAGWMDRREGHKPFHKTPSFPALAESVDAVFEERIGDVSGRGKLGADMREIWMMQPRFEKRSGASVFSLLTHLRFRAGFDFLCLRAQSEEANREALSALAAWWQDFQVVDQATRESMLAALKAKAPRPTKTKVNASSNPSTDLAGASDGVTAPVKRRARRPRKPKTEGGLGPAQGLPPAGGDS